MLYASEFLERIRVPLRSPETLATFLQYPKARQDELKDAAGGYVGGALAGNRRKAASVTGRDIITLDLDNIQPGGTADVLRRLEGLECWYAVHSTRKHEEARPRLRVFFVPGRTLSADEYEPVARKMGQLIGIELCDPSTFEIGRLMFFPTCSADSQYVFRYGDKPFLNPDGILNMYANWRDVREWPQVPGAEQTHVRLAAKQEDPTSKNGVIGAFCRCYDVYEAMEVFLPDAYTPIDDGSGRFTFTGGSTAGGAVVYDGGKFLFSHHATDPAGGKLVNSFDLVRLHRFHELDDDAKPETPVNKLPSFAAMQELALKDPKVSELLNRERYEEISRDFGDLAGDDVENASEATDGSWMSLLQRNQSTGQFLKSIRNVQIVLQSDPLLRGRIYKDSFADQLMGIAPLPWGSRRKEVGPFKWGDDDEDGLLVYMDRLLNIQGLRAIGSALRDHAAANKRNPVREYFESLEWDGQPRLDTLYIDYLGAEDCVYTRAVTRKAFVAAVARVMEDDGVKFDSMTVVCGPQNLGKSTLFRKMGKQWFTDSVKSFEHKEAEELIQGKLIVEIAELQAFNKADINRVKMFLSKLDDQYRPAYGRHVKTQTRKSVFFGTTNDHEYLRDPTGNRRFWPVDAMAQTPTKTVFGDLDSEVDQLWAEAFMRWRLGEPVYLSKELEEEADRRREDHFENDPRTGMIIEFLERPVPEDWNSRSIDVRRIFLRSTFPSEQEQAVVQRTKVCAAEIWTECLHLKDDDAIGRMRKSDAREINSILKRLPAWEECRETFGPYGSCRGFKRR